MLNRWQRTIVDLRGNVVPYAQLQIRVESTQATAAIYADRAGNELIPNGIVTADANGYAYFYAEADLYRISSMQPTIDWRYVDIGSANAVRIATEALDENLVTYPTLAELQADTTRDVNSMGRVVNDGSNNGYYLWDGTSWVRTSYQPMQRDEFDDLVLHVENDFLRKDIEQSAPLLRDIPQVGVVGLPYDVDQLYAQIWAARYPGLPAPSAYFEFGAGARLLSPDLTFSRASSAWGWRNGVLVEYGIDEPVFENGGLRLEPQVTNYVPYSNNPQQLWPGITYVPSDLSHLGVSLQGVSLDSGYAYRTITMGAGRRGLVCIGNTGNAGAFPIYLRDPTTTWSGEFLFEDGSKLSLEDAHRPTGLPKNMSFLLRGEFTSDAETLQLAIHSEDIEDAFYLGYVGILSLPQAGGFYIPTHGSPATRAADQFQWTGSSFDRAFNPTQGAFIFKIGEKSGLPRLSGISPYYGAALWTETGSVIDYSAGGVYLSAPPAQGHLRGIGVKALNKERHINVITHNMYPGDTVGLSWQGETISLFVNGALAGSFTHPDVVGALQAVKRFHVPNAQHMYLERPTMFTTRPTDAEMEALTYA